LTTKSTASPQYSRDAQLNVLSAIDYHQNAKKAPFCGLKKPLLTPQKAISQHQKATFEKGIFVTF
jgi:hypothetical protein